MDITNNSITPDSLKTEYVTPGKCIFSQSKNGFLSAEINGEIYNRVILSRALPLNAPDDYICISDTQKHEIGIIEHISAFSREQQELINYELSQRYFCPDITEIEAIKEKMGHFYFDVKIGQYKRSFTVRDLSKNIRCIGSNITLTDVDGNRYMISDINQINKKSRKKLEPYLY